MRKIRVGIIGQGRSGYGIHYQAFRAMPGKFKVAAVCDLLPDRCQEAVSEFGSAAYTDYREMLKRDDLDLVVNATPSHFHVPISLEIMDTGRNVLCEKPLARCVLEVDRLIAKSRETGKLLAIFQQSRFAPYYLQVKKVVESPVLGRIVMVKAASNGFGRRYDWQTIREYYAGSLLNTGPHPLDQIVALFGSERMPKIACIMDRVNTCGDAEDHVKMLMHGEDWPTVDLEISSCCAYPQYTYQIYGQHGGLTGTNDHIQWRYFKPEEAPKLELTRVPLPNRAYPSDSLKWYSKSWDVPPSQSGFFATMSGRFYNNLHSALTKGTPLEITPEQVRRQIAIIEECHRQNDNSRVG